jgi:3-deoxy-7-phosphoheptulonate synthase
METNPKNTWTPSSWRMFPAAQQPEWPDSGELIAACKELSGLPPLVFAGEARALRRQLANVSAAKAFLLQAGDCAESFFEKSADQIRDKLKVILQMAAVLTYGAGMPVVKVGRIAGQFAKPRTNPYETIGNTKIPAFRGHIINSDEPTEAARRPNPRRMIEAYHQSAFTLNLLRAFTKGGFADLSQVHSWNQEFVATSAEGRHYEQMASEIDRALKFMRACGIDLESEANLHQVDFWTSHEALLLDYEEALTRVDSLTGKYYGCSAHMLWVGERTRDPKGAHIEYLSGIDNPIGVKLGATAEESEVEEICRILNPENAAGRLCLITRMGVENIETVLPKIIKTVIKNEFNVAWICDPMHGNTFVAPNGRKTRNFKDIISEIELFFDIHHSLDTWPGGIHVELTGDNVTECLGGESAVVMENLDVNYTTACDPRLNARQAIDMAFKVAGLLKNS